MTDMTISSKQRAALRAEAHHLQALVHVGHGGVTRTVLQTIDDALRTRELVKLHIVKRDGDELRDVVGALANDLGADVVQIIGHTTTLYRENPELERKPGALPPWRR